MNPFHLGFDAATATVPSLDESKETEPANRNVGLQI
jgi:hypothetical protein